MKKEVGVWIDHREAVIVTMAGDGEEIQRIRADAEANDGSSSNAPTGSPEDRHDRRTEGFLQKYYGEVAKAIYKADSILVIGPGEAKGEFEKWLEHEKLSDRIVGIEAADKLTEPQIVAKIRRYFEK